MEVDLDRVADTVAESPSDKDLIPLLQFGRGAGNFQWARRNWNLFNGLFSAQVESFTSGSKTATADNDFRHLTGFHNKAIAKQSLVQFAGRFIQSPSLLERTPDIDRWLAELLSQERHVLLPQRQEVYPWSTLAWRRPEPTPRYCQHPSCNTRLRGRALKWCIGHGGKQTELISPDTLLWKDSKLEGADLMQAVDAAIPPKITGAARQDICGDVVLSVLSGECSSDDLNDAVSEAVKTYNRMYGFNLSLDKELGSPDSDFNLKMVIPDVNASPELCWGCEGSTSLVAEGLCKECYLVVQMKQEQDRAHDELNRAAAKRDADYRKPRKRVKDRKLEEMLEQEGKTKGDWISNRGTGSTKKIMQRRGRRELRERAGYR